MVNTTLEKLATYERYSPDLVADPFQRWLHRRYCWLWVYVAHALLFGLFTLGIGWLMAGWTWEGLRISTSLWLWLVVVRTVYVWHITWLVNSASHVWGYRNYATHDTSRNNWVVAMLTNGEGWHNNHHASPRAAAHGHRWYEIDLTYATIVMMEWLGLAQKVVPVKVPKALLTETAGVVGPDNDQMQGAA
jgi:stearoyl-CoA desaturase (delta-9 desaturase)